MKRNMRLVYFPNINFIKLYEFQNETKQFQESKSMSYKQRGRGENPAVIKETRVSQFTSTI